VRVKVDGEHVWREVKKLPGEQRQVIVMRFIDDLGYPDIASVLGKSVGAVRVIQFRALANLRQMLDDQLNRTGVSALTFHREPGRLPARRCVRP
jgi:DNA-directed RNA polymerase specialized sigma24 family protein